MLFGTPPNTRPTHCHARSSCSSQVHLSPADGKEDGAPARCDGVIVRFHGAVKGLPGPMGLAHQGLGPLQLRPDPYSLWYTNNNPLQKGYSFPSKP